MADESTGFFRPSEPYTTKLQWTGKESPFRPYQDDHRVDGNLSDDRTPPERRSYRRYLLFHPVDIVRSVAALYE